MGKIEKKAEKVAKRANIEQLILNVVIVGGVLAVGLVAPNVIGAMGRMGLIPSSRQGEVVKRAQKNLVKKGWLKWENGKLRITEKGKRARSLYVLKSEGIPKPRRWDGKWRIVIFDVPEYRRDTRVALRGMLKDIGFCCLQGSVWVHPYDCEDAIALVKAELRIGNDVLYIIADAIENDKYLREHFKLRKL